MKQNKIPEPPEDKKLQEIIWLVRHGQKPLHKLVPSGYLGYPGWDSYGVCIRESNEDQFANEDKNLSVSLNAAYSFFHKKWHCYIQINDGDDYIRLLDKTLTYENWTELINIYNSLDFIFEDYLKDLDFI